MPPRIKFSRQEIVHAAFRLVRRDGEEALNARAVAVELGCSTQPLFRAFASMDELKDEVLKQAYSVYKGYLARSGSLTPNTPYKGTGVSYILFANSEPNLFKLLFMRDRAQEAPEADPTLDFVLGFLMKRTGYSREQAEAFHKHMWIYVHGLAVMLATKFVSLDRDMIEQLMSQQFQAMRLLFDRDGNT